MFQKKQLVVVAPFLAKQNSVSPSNPIASFVAPKLNWVEFEEKRLGEAFSVTTIETKDTILKICSERNDEWSEAIRARLMNVHDLPAADAIYHQTCNVNFRPNRQLPQLYETDELPAAKERKVGRPENEEKNRLL